MVSENMYKFAQEVAYDLRSPQGRDRFKFDDGSASLSDDQMQIKSEMEDSGIWDLEAFNTALQQANESFANDLVEGNLEPKNLACEERRLASQLDEFRQLGNEEVLDSAKAFVKATLIDEIHDAGAGNGTFIVRTKASWTGLLVNAGNALGRALKGDFSGQSGLDYFAKERGAYDDQGKALKTAAKALKADVKEHFEDNPLEVTAKTGLSAEMETTAARI